MRCVIRTAAAVAAALLLAAPAAAQQRKGVKEECARLAEGIKAAAAADGQQSVQIGEFNPVVPKDERVGGIFAAELSVALGNFVSKDAAFIVKGDYSALIETDDKSAVFVQVNVELVKVQNGRVQKRFPFEAEIRVIADLGRVGNPTGPIPLGGSAAAASQALKEIVEKPKGAARTPTLVQPHDRSDFAVEILAKPGGGGKAAPRAVQVVNGEPRVEIAQHEAYEVRVLNFGAHEAAFNLFVDGLDQFTFTDDRKADGRPAYSHIILPPGTRDRPGEATVRGWHKKFDKQAREHHYLEFLVTENGKGAISKFPTQSRAKVGVLLVEFALAYPPGTKNKDTRGGSGETGFGKPGKTGGDVVNRVIDSPHEFLAVRYLRNGK
jgi:hypothetical protein